MKDCNSYTIESDCNSASCKWNNNNDVGNKCILLNPAFCYPGVLSRKGPTEIFAEILPSSTQ